MFLYHMFLLAVLALTMHKPHLFFEKTANPKFRFNLFKTQLRTEDTRLRMVTVNLERLSYDLEKSGCNLFHGSMFGKTKAMVIRATKTSN